MQSLTTSFRRVRWLSAVLASASIGACAGGDIGVEDDSASLAVEPETPAPADAVTSIGSASFALRAACTPAADQVAFFVDSDFRGACSVRGVGDYPSAGALGVPNDSVSSVVLGSNAQLILCKDNGFGGDCIRLTTSASILSGDRVGNDSVSSGRVQAVGTQECVPGPGQVGLFVHADFIGPCVVKDRGTYPNAGQIGLPNDSISSIRVGADVQVTLCEDNDFGGDCERFVNDINFLGDDNTSSARVEPVENCSVDDHRLCIPLLGCFGSCTQTCCHDEAPDLQLCEESSCD